jgi:hypothetical protein
LHRKPVDVAKGTVDSEPKPPASAFDRFLTHVFMTFGILWMLVCGTCTAGMLVPAAYELWQKPSLGSAAGYLLSLSVIRGLGWLFGRIGYAVYRHNKALKDKGG